MLLDEIAVGDRPPHQALVHRNGRAQLGRIRVVLVGGAADDDLVALGDSEQRPLEAQGVTDIAGDLEQQPVVRSLLGQARIQFDHPLPIGRLPSQAVEQSGVFQGGRQLVGHRLQDDEVVVIERVRFGALNIQGADHAFADAQRQGQLRPGVGQIRIGEVDGVGADIQRDARFAGAGDITDQADFAHGQAVAVLEHAPAAFGRDGPQNGIFPFRQENSSMVEGETVGDQAHDLVEQGIDVVNEGGVACHLGSGLDLVRPFGDALLQGAVHRRQLGRHGVERLGQPADLVTAFDRHPLLELTAGDALNDLGQRRQRAQRLACGQRHE